MNTEHEGQVTQPAQASASTEGWGWPLFAVKPHYFVDGVSLCGAHTFGYRQLTSGRGRGELDCAKCQVRLARRGIPPTQHTPEEVH